MAADILANVSKAVIFNANLIGRWSSLFHEGHGRLSAKVLNLCECTADGFKGKGIHFSVKYDDGDIGCATLASVLEKLVPLAAPATPGPEESKKWKRPQIKNLEWLVGLDTQVKIGDGIYVGTVEKLCNCKRKEIVKNGWHFHLQYADGDKGCACVEDVRRGVINTSKIPVEQIPSKPVATPVVVVDSLAAFKNAHSGQDSVEKNLPQYKKPVKVAVKDGRKRTSTKGDTPKTRSRRKRSGSKVFLVDPAECECLVNNCKLACAAVTKADVEALRADYLKGKSFQKIAVRHVPVLSCIFIKCVPHHAVFNMLCPLCCVFAKNVCGVCRQERIFWRS